MKIEGFFGARFEPRFHVDPQPDAVDDQQDDRRQGHAEKRCAVALQNRRHLGRPRVSGFDVGALLKAVLGEQVGAIVDKGKDAIEDAIKGEKDKLKDATKAETDKAKAKAKEEADKAKAAAAKRAKQEADKAKQKAKDALGGLLGGKKK